MPIQILMVEDNELDAAWLTEALRRSGVATQVRHVDSRAPLLAALDQQAWDIVLCDYSIPGLDLSEVIALARAADPNLPLIVVTGTIDEESAIAVMQAGAADLILKSRIARLRPAIEREVAAAAARRQSLAAEQARLQSDSMLRSIAKNIPGLIFRRVMQTDGTVYYTFMQRDILGDFFDTDNAPDVADMQGTPFITDRNTSLLRAIHHDDRRAYQEAMRRSADRLEQMMVEFRIIDHAGRIRWLRSQSQPERLADGSVQWDGIALDVTALKEAQKLRDTLAYFDQVTGLPNRTQFSRALSHLLQEAKDKQPVALLCLGIDAFHEFQDGWGLAATDALLRAVALRLTGLLLPGEALARLEGGYFTIVIPDAPEDLTPRLLQIQRGFETPLLVDNVQLFRRMNIGVALYPDDAREPAELLQHASTALHAVRSAGVPFQKYTATMTERAIKQQWLQSALGVALESGDIELFYQPLVHPLTNAINGIEGLVRWRHPEKGLISPADFIPAAEQGGQIIELGLEVLRQAIDSAIHWRAQGLMNFPISVNVSGVQLMQPTFSGQVLDLLAGAALPPSMLNLELTESTIIRDIDVVDRNIAELAAAGVTFALDDFGMEHSVFSRLSELPIDTVKIDRFFVSQMTDDVAHAALVQAIVAMAHAMRKRVVAEGVETQEELIYLRAYQCDALQGYLFSRPVPKAAMETLLQRGKLG